MCIGLFCRQGKKLTERLSDGWLRTVCVLLYRASTKYELKKRKISQIPSRILPPLMKIHGNLRANFTVALKFDSCSSDVWYTHQDSLEMRMNRKFRSNYSNPVANVHITREERCDIPLDYDTRRWHSKTTFHAFSASIAWSPRFGWLTGASVYSLCYLSKNWKSYGPGRISS